MPRGRIDTLFRLVRGYAATRVPWLDAVSWKTCRFADRVHEKEGWRFFAHSGHLDVYTVCFCRAAEYELSDEEIIGISAHELGHVVGIRDGWPCHEYTTGRDMRIEREADRIAKTVLGFRSLRYNRRALQEIRIGL